MFYDTFIIGLLQFLSPGSLLVSLLLLFIIFAFGRTPKLQMITAIAYMLGVVLLYFVVIQNGYTYLRYLFIDEGIIAAAYLVFGGAFFLYGVFLFFLWIKSVRLKNDISVFPGQKFFKFSAVPKERVWQIGLVLVSSFSLGCAAGFLALNWVDNHQVLRFLVQAIIGQDFAVYFSLVGLYVFMLMLPVFIVFMLSTYLRKSQLFNAHQFLRYFIVINAALFLAVGSSYYLIK